MVIADAQKPFAAAESCDLTNLLLGEIQDILNQPRLLFFHLHDDLDAAGIQNPFAVLAVIQREQILHTLRGRDGDTAEAADGLDHLLNIACRQRIGVCTDQRPEFV